jgi:LysM repeat protein
MLGVLWLVLLACVGLTAGIGVRLQVLAMAGLTGASIDRLVEVGILAVGLALAAWLTGSIALAALCVAGRAAGVTWRAGERLIARYAPLVVRRALVAAVGAGIGLSAATGAHATPPADHDLGWVSTASAVTATTASVGSAANPTQARTQASTREEATALPATDTVVVDPGDTLWRIAERRLPPDAGAADIATSWHAWYAANTDVIGTDPDLIHPGQVLHAPSSTPTDGAP